MYAGLNGKYLKATRINKDILSTRKEHENFLQKIHENHDNTEKEINSSVEVVCKKVKDTI